MESRFKLVDGLALLIFCGLILLDIYLFRIAWNRNYLDWYLRNGAQISWLLALLTLIWGDLNKNMSLISARPLEYLSAYAILLGVVFGSLGTVFGKRRSLEEKPVTSYRSIDILFSLLILVVFISVLLVWTIVIVPIQYFVFLLCGAPGRQLVYSSERLIAKISYPSSIEFIGSGETAPTGWWDAGLAQKPVSLTAGFAGMLFWLLQIVL